MQLAVIVHDGAVRKPARVVVASVVLAGAVAACSSGTAVEGEGGVSTGELAAEYALPFGLAQVEGTVPVARPAVAEQVTSLFNGEPVNSTSLRAAYWVTGSPREVMATWSEQFAELGVAEIAVTMPPPNESTVPTPWMELSAHSSGPASSSVEAELWATSDEPLLLVEVDLAPDAVPVPVATSELPELPAAPTPISVALASEGDEVFGPRGAEVHLPTGATQVMPDVPSVSGTDGDVVMLRTADPLGTVQALVQEAYDFNEARPQHEPGWIDGPHEGELDGSTTVAARFSSGSGGWGFTVLASQAPEDLASVWVRTHAD